MKKAIGFMLGLALVCGIGGVSSSYASAKAENGVYYAQKQENKAKNGLNMRAKASYLMDFGANTVMHAHNERDHLPIASMCKIMTLLLSFEAVDEGALDMSEEICISQRAASMGGSQVFLEANAKYPVKELIKSIVVCSANDSCVAMAERVAGSEELFVEKMNERARRLGMQDTLFANCTGLPKEPQYSCARDVAIMLKELLKHEEYYEFGKVWMDKFAHPEGRRTDITNTNKLVRFYDGCDGGKTGFTNEAGFCLAATAKRGDMRIISVVIGEESSANRFEDVRATFDYAFANYTVSPIAQVGVPIEQVAKVSGGKKDSVMLIPERSAYAFTKRGEKSNVTVELQIKKIKAPVTQGEAVGELLIFKEGIEIDKVPLLAAEDVNKANFMDRFKDIAKEWNH